MLSYGGRVTELIAGATGVFIVTTVPYLQAPGLVKNDPVQALGRPFTTSTIGLALHHVCHADQLAGHGGSRPMAAAYAAA